MKKSIVLDIVCLLLILTVIGIPIAIYLLRRRDDYGKSDTILKPSIEVKEKKYEEEKRKFTPLYTETTILPVLTEEDLKKYKKVEKKEEVKKVEVKEPKKVEVPKKKKKNNTTNKKNYNNKKNGKVYYKKQNKKNKKKGV